MGCVCGSELEGGVVESGWPGYGVWGGGNIWVVSAMPNYLDDVEKKQTAWAMK